MASHMHVLLSNHSCESACGLQKAKLCYHVFHGLTGRINLHKKKFLR